MSVVRDGGPRCFVHEAFVYEGDDDYVGVLVPLMTAALAADSRVIAVVPPRSAGLLRCALGDTAAGARWVDARDWYRRPSRTIAGYARTLAELPAGASAFVIGEVPFGDAPDRLAWTRYEAALNRALDRHAAHVVCPYDARALPSAVTHDARRTHPHLQGGDGSRPSGAYVEPEDLLRELARPVVAPAGPPDVVVDLDGSIAVARRAFAAAAMVWGLTAGRADELSLAVSEVVTNAVVHGGGVASLRVWCRHDLTCVVDDGGAGNDDPLLGYVPPLPGSLGGYGLWVTRQLFDRTELGRSPAGGLRVLLAVDA